MTIPFVQYGRVASLHRANTKQWTDAEKRAIAAFAGTFKPAWDPPKGQFSDWHYLALSPLHDSGIYHYTGPVIVLMNATNFSATDIFLTGLKGMKNVTLLGTASSGGSANTQTVTLGKTPLVLRIGAMASFQSDGRLFDGNGVSPDVAVNPVPYYYIGGPDNALTEALKRIQRGEPPR